MFLDVISQQKCSCKNRSYKKAKDVQALLITTEVSTLQYLTWSVFHMQPWPKYMKQTLVNYGESLISTFKQFYARCWISNPGVPCSKPPPRSTQPFIFLQRLMSTRNSRNFVIKSKLPPWSGSSLKAVEPNSQKGAIKLFFFHNWKKFHFLGGRFGTRLEFYEDLRSS